MKLPSFAEQLQEWLIDGNDPFLVPLSDDPEYHDLGIDGGHGESNGIADSQTGDVHGFQAGAIDGMLDGIDEALAVLMGLGNG